MKTLERINQLTQLWNAIVPFCLPPAESQMVIWARQFTDEEMEYGFNRARSKFGPHRGVRCPDAEIVHRYTTGVLVSARREQYQTAGYALSGQETR